jgi:hypothetical protein
MREKKRAKMIAQKKRLRKKHRMHLLYFLLIGLVAGCFLGYFGRKYLYGDERQITQMRNFYNERLAEVKAKLVELDG